MGTSVAMIEDHYGHVTHVGNANRILQGMTGWQAIPAEPDEAEAPTKASKGKKASADPAGDGRRVQIPVPSGDFLWPAGYQCRVRRAGRLNCLAGRPEQRRRV
jgi:hypothetical protein